MLKNVFKLVLVVVASYLLLLVVSEGNAFVAQRLYRIQEVKDLTDIEPLRKGVVAPLVEEIGKLVVGLSISFLFRAKGKQRIYYVAAVAGCFSLFETQQWWNSGRLETTELLYLRLAVTTVMHVAVSTLGAMSVWFSPSSVILHAMFNNITNVTLVGGGIYAYSVLAVSIAVFYGGKTRWARFATTTAFVVMAGVVSFSLLAQMLP